MCRSRNSQAEQATDFAGYATAIALVQATKEWSSIHKYALTVIAHSLFRIAGGVEASLRQGQIVAFGLSSQRAESPPADSDENMNPSTAFCLQSAKILLAEGPLSFCRQEEHPTLDAEYGELGFFSGDSANATPAGLIGTACFVEGTTHVTATSYPVYRASHHPDDTPLDDDMTAIFQDVSTIFTTLINNRVVLRPPSDGCQALPNAGRIVRVRKGWRWEQDQRAWQLVEIVRPPRYGILFETFIFAAALWARFRQW
ncbi:hypothetical protein LXA43DRAFT_1068244 [Ganoderma leucocontextum]|nr:hypothetical protein LXA43DRAFT_1068244 [Ganoderma leucocontextum]